MSGPVRPRSTFVHGPSRRAGPGRVTLVRATALALAVILAACASPTPSAAPTPAPTSAASATAGPSPSSVPTQASSGWTALGRVADPAPIATLTPSSLAGGRIPVNATFRLVSTSGEPAAALAARVVIEPAVVMAVEPGPDASTATLRPARPFAAGTAVRVTLPGRDGMPAASWAYEVDRGPTVVSVVPGDGVGDVPISTGIEAAFDQDGVAVTAADFSITPAVTGRVETHGRVVAFVPTALKRGTIYTVTLRAGVGRPGSPYHLEHAVTWSFETTVAATDPRAEASLATHVVDARPGERALLPVDRSVPDEITPLASGTVVVRRMAGPDQAITAIRALLAVPNGFEAARYVTVASGSLPIVQRGTVRFSDVSGGSLAGALLPAPLPAGWYLVALTAAGRTSQAVLQVSAIAPYVTITSTSTLAWVNDSVRHGPLAGVRVSVDRGATLGTTDAAGLLVTTTPAALKPIDQASDTIWAPAIRDPQTIVRFAAADGRRSYLVLASDACCMDHVARGQAASPADGWWHALSTDRLQYRSTDTVNVWGVLRNRATLAVPTEAEVRLVAEAGGPAIARATVHPDARGAFAAALPITDLPLSSYLVELRTSGTLAAQSWLEVATIRKPLYRLAVTVDHKAILAGTTFDIGIAATFYEGSPAGGVDAAASIDTASDAPTTVRTAGDGTAAATLTAGLDGDSPQLGWQDHGIDVRAGTAEEGEVSTSSGILVFPSLVLVDAKATLTGTRLAVSGAVHVTDLARLNGLSTIDAARAANPRGSAVARTPVGLRITEITPVRKRTGTSYDPITKQTVPVYDTTFQRKVIASRTISTRSDGTFVLALSVRGGTRSYEVLATAHDGAGRAAGAQAGASALTTPDWTSPLSFAAVVEGRCPDGCRVGQSYTLKLEGASAPKAGGTNRYLFLVEQAGLRRWTITTKPTQVEQFRASDAPNVVHDAVRWTGTEYVVVDGTRMATAALAPRTLRVTVTADKASYQPGGQAALHIAVTDAQGRPVAATLVAAVVDEKLITSAGGEPVQDPLSLLYEMLPSGVITGGWTPAQWRYDGGKGSTGGGGGDGRSDFRDALLFRAIPTNARGLADVVVPLSDDLTTWRVTVGAMGADVTGGLGTASLPVGLPFFADATSAPEYLASDRPSIVVRAFGRSISPTTVVRFTVSSSTLGMPATTVEAPAATGATVALPPLTAGVQRITVSATAGSSSDALTRQFVVVGTRRTTPIVQAWTVTAALAPDGAAAGLTTYLVADGGRGRWVARLAELAAGSGTRSDQRVAARAAIALLVGTYGVDPATLPAPPDLGAFLQDGAALSIVSYGSTDLEMTVRNLLAAPAQAGGPRTAGWLAAVAADPAQTDERRSVALAGLATLGEPVLARIVARLGDPTVGDRERLYLGLGAAALGDEATGRAVVADIATRLGQRRGLQVRILVPNDPEATAEATARFAALAAAVGSPLAEPALAYAQANQRTADLDLAEEVATITALVRRSVPAAAVAAWTVNGERTTADLSDGRVRTLVLTPTQRAALRIEAISGTLSVVGAWAGAGAPTNAPSDQLQLARTVNPVGDLARSAIVRVALDPTFGPDAPRGSYSVVELLPSGLAPLDLVGSWPVEGADPAQCTYPSRLDGQRIEFGVLNPRNGSGTILPVHMCYAARIVTPGTYTWEPATITADVAPEVWAATAPATMTIR